MWLNWLNWWISVLWELASSWSNTSNHIRVDFFTPIFRLYYFSLRCQKIISTILIFNPWLWLLQVELLTMVHHKYLVALVGYCLARNHRYMLVYEHMGGGDLRRRLQGKHSLHWNLYIYFHYILKSILQIYQVRPVLTCIRMLHINPRGHLL